VALPQQEYSHYPLRLYQFKDLNHVVIKKQPWDKNTQLPLTLVHFKLLKDGQMSSISPNLEKIAAMLVKLLYFKNLKIDDRTPALFIHSKTFRFHFTIATRTAGNSILDTNFNFRAG